MGFGAAQPLAMRIVSFITVTAQPRGIPNPEQAGMICQEWIYINVEVWLSLIIRHKVPLGN